MSVKVAIIAALEREIAPLIKGWAVFEGVDAAYRTFQREETLVVCAGIGGKAAERAATSVLQYRPEVLVSAGIAGGVSPEATTARVFMPSTVIDQTTGGRYSAEGDDSVLVSACEVLTVEAKHEIAAQFCAQIVDMEAAAVAKVAQGNGIPFRAVKAVSDPCDFSMPDMSPFIDDRGRFHTARFVARAAFRPVQWGTIRVLAGNTARASQELCSALLNLMEKGIWPCGSSRSVRSAIAQGETRIS